MAASGTAPQAAMAYDELLLQCPASARWDANRFRVAGVIQHAPRNKGSVELVEDCEFNRLVAVKVMPHSWVCENHAAFVATYPGENEQPWRDITTSLYLNKYARLNCVCEFVGLYHRLDGDSHQICMVLSYCSGGDLFSWLEKTQSVTRSDRESIMAPLMRRVFQGVHSIHAQGIAHGDLSLENVLIQTAEAAASEAPDVCIIDFGASTGKRSRGVHGKSSYQAPEMHSGEEYDAQLADVFALGVMVFTLVVGDYPWKSTQTFFCPRFRYAVQSGILALLTRQKVKCENGEVVSLVTTLSPSLIELLIGLLSPNPKHRLDLAAALNLPWFLQDAPGRDARPPGTSPDPQG